MSNQSRIPEIVAFRQPDVKQEEPDTLPRNEIADFGVPKHLRLKRPDSVISQTAPATDQPISKVIEGLFPENDEPIVKDVASFRQGMLDMALHRGENRTKKAA